MQSEEIRSKFLRFFENRGHEIIPSASLVPENDPSVLFTTAGMQPLVQYLLGQVHSKGKRLVGVQKCVRTQDIEEVGDNTHDTFFEMLGNWSLGDYFREDAIKWSYEFLTSKEDGLGLDPSRLYITVFEGNENAPKDIESVDVWRSVGIPDSRIYFQGVEDNWWSPGDNGPCGPDTEMFYDVTEKGLGDMTFEEFKQADEDQKVVEVWNDVFMEYEKKQAKIVGKLIQKNVDTGAGLERLTMMMQKKNNVFDTDLFAPLMNKIKEISTSSNEKAFRIIADHLRTSVFIISDGVVPSNTDRGYILRRLLRRAVRYSDMVGIKDIDFDTLVDVVINKYKDVYPSLKENNLKIKKEINNEVLKFRKTLSNGLRELKKIAIPRLKKHEEGKEIGIGIPLNGKELFNIFSTYGFPLEMSLEEIERLREEHKLPKFTNDRIQKISEEFNIEMEKHQALSRTASAGKFKGGLAGDDENSIKLHTATHLLNQALREVLGAHVEQKGSNITPERLRFDFSHSQKMTDEEKQKVEDIVNEKIKEGLIVKVEEVTVEEAKKSGALGVFGDKYGDKISVYSIGDFSKEICGGPHVKNTSELTHFKIKKEMASSAGIRRIKAKLE